MTSTAIYPGTFDPITSGHLDIIRRALYLTDKLVIAVAEDIPKTPIFGSNERVKLVETAVQETLPAADAKRISVAPFQGLLVDFVKKHQAHVIIRGLRAISDFEYEFQMAHMNARLAGDIQTTFLPASEDTHFISSRFVKEIARLGGDISGFVSPSVAQAVEAYYQQHQTGE